jgi:hypothetical protein
MVEFNQVGCSRPLPISTTRCWFLLTHHPRTGTTRSRSPGSPQWQQQNGSKRTWQQIHLTDPHLDCEFTGRELVDVQGQEGALPNTICQLNIHAQIFVVVSCVCCLLLVVVVALVVVVVGTNKDWGPQNKVSEFILEFVWCPLRASMEFLLLFSIM